MKANRLVALSIVMSSTIASHACICVTSSGSWAAVSNEVALLVWDKQHQTEHFIRNISFEHNAKSFGFLIQTPSVPEIKEADGKVFDILDEYRIEIISQMIRDSGAGSAVDYVEVMAVQKAAGLVATTLKASSADSLITWMKSHNYSFDVNVKSWVQPYIDKKWPITAFKIDPDVRRKGKPVTPKVLRLSFKTDNLFYPYRGYQQDRANSSTLKRNLLLYVLAENPVACQTEAGQKIVGEVLKDGVVPEPILRQIAEYSGVEVEVFKNANTLTRFSENVNATERTSDLTFTDKPKIALASKNKVSQNPALLFGGGAAILGGLGFIVSRNLRRSRHR